MEIPVRKGRVAECDFFGKHIDIHCGMRKMDFNVIYLTYLTNTECACYVPGTVLSA